jgi:4-hydroxy-4-methyl-2-oxoglutarate aldolase
MAEPTDTLLELGAATVGEAGGSAMAPRVRPVWAGARLAAPAFTVRCTPGDNLGVHAGVARAPAGSALVVEVGIDRELGYWGEVLTTAAEARGLAGLVIDACVRDVAALEAHGFPVFSTGIALPGASKVLPAQVGAPAEVGGVVVRTGDWLVGDVDGVAVVAAADLDAVVASGRARAGREAEMFAALRNGSTTLELLELDETRVTGP